MTSYDTIMTIEQNLHTVLLKIFFCDVTDMKCEKIELVPLYSVQSNYSQISHKQ